MKRIIFLIALIFSFLNANITEQFPKLDGRIIDQTQILSSKVKEDINAILNDHENRRKIQIEVVILKSLNGFEIENFSTLLMKHWELGKDDKRAVLILISMTEKKIHIEVDKKARTSLNENIKNEIINYTLEPNLKAQQYELGILKTINEIILALQGEYISKENTNFSKDHRFNFLVTLSFFGIIFCAMYINFISKNKRNLFFNISLSLINSSYFGFLTFVILKEFTEYYLTLSAIIFFLIFIINYIFTKKFRQKGANDGW